MLDLYFNNRNENCKLLTRKLQSHRPNSIWELEELFLVFSCEYDYSITFIFLVKQGQLYKRSSKTLNKEWKKKYVCLYSDGRICYHKNLKVIRTYQLIQYKHYLSFKDYMEKDSKGKEIYLGLATVRISGRNRLRATNRNSLLPQPPEKENYRPTTSSVHESLPSPISSDVKSPAGARKTSDAGDAFTISLGNSDGEGTGALATSTSSSLLLNVAAAPEKSNRKEKKKKGRRTGVHSKNEDGMCIVLYQIIIYQIRYTNSNYK